MLKVHNLRKQYSTDFWVKPFLALDDVSFEVPKGKIVGFLGANGAGKTTSLKIILNFIKPTSGHVEFDPSLGSGMSEVLSKIGYVPERPYFYPHLTGKEFAIYMGSLSNMHKPEILSSLDRWAKRLKIDFALDRKIRTYSKGMLQRLGFVCALVHDPQLIILDEPVSGLDPIGRREIKDVISEINREGKTVFFSSHIVPDVEEICDTVVFLEKGKLFYQGSIDQLIYDNLKTSFEIKYKSSVNSVIEKQLLSNQEKDPFLKKLLDQKAEIISVLQEKQSLEEILYKIKQQERVMSHE